MRRVALIALILSGPLALARVNTFELPWMNSATTGTSYKSTDHPNGVFVVEAYFLGCGYCNQNAPNVNDLARKYETEARVQVLDVGVDRNDSSYKEWIRRHQPNHPVLKDGNQALIGQLGTSGYPSTYVIDCRGKVLTETSGVWGSEERAQLERAINEGLKTSCVLND